MGGKRRGGNKNVAELAIPTPQMLMQEWESNIHKFAKEAFDWREGESLSFQQIELFNLVVELAKAKIKAYRKQELNEREEFLSKKIGISIKGGRGTGKDTSLAILLIWFLIHWEHCLGMVTAPTSHQLKDVLWAEIAQRLRLFKLNEYIEWQAKEIRMKGVKGEWFIAARTLNKNASPDEQGETLSGRHNKYMILAADEAAGIPMPVFTPMESSLTGMMNLAILIGNPTRTYGYFFDTFHKNRTQWLTLTWNAEESHLVPKHKIEATESNYGKSSNFYRINVLGEFAVDDESTLIPYDWIVDSFDREVLENDDDPIIFGVDVAGSGGDKSVILIRRGDKIIDIMAWPDLSTMGLVGWITQGIDEESPKAVYVDEIGLGAGVVSRLRELGHYCVHGINAANVAYDEKRFGRLKDELGWTVRTKFEEKVISLPSHHQYIDDLVGQISSIKVDEPESSGKIVIEPKKKRRKRLGLTKGSSPDFWDALYLSYAFNDKPFRQNSDMWKSARKRTKQQETVNEHGFMGV